MWILSLFFFNRKGHKEVSFFNRKERKGGRKGYKDASLFFLTAKNAKKVAKGTRTLRFLVFLAKTQSRKVLFTLRFFWNADGMDLLCKTRIVADWIASLFFLTAKNAKKVAKGTRTLRFLRNSDWWDLLCRPRFFLVLQLCDIVKRRELTEFLSLFSYYLVT
jgi:hypothetical protein